MKKLKKYGWILVLALFLTMGFSVGSEAAYPSNFSASHPIVSYPLKKTKKTVLYKDSAMTEKLKSLSYREFTICRVKNKAFYVKCKVAGKTVKGWVAKTTFLSSKTYQPKQTYVNSSLTLYKGKSSSLYFKTIPQYTGGATVGASGSWYQTMFYVGGKYYLGWVSQNEYSKVRLSMDTTEQPLANGIYTIGSRKKSGTVLTWDGETGTVSLQKKTGKKNQQFVLAFVKGSKSNYEITPYKGEGYLSLIDGKLGITGTAATWTFTRYGRYFALQEDKSGKGIAYVSGEGIGEVSYRKSASGQNWIFTKTTGTTASDEVTVFSQYDPKWGGATYCNGNPIRTISTSGCGVVSYVNAIYALNGEYISPTMLANYSNSHGHYYYMQGTADTLYEDFARNSGKYYHFKWDGKVTDFGSLRNNLKKVGTAVELVPGHYIAIVDYRESDNSYLVLDSAIYGKRPTTINGDWLSESTLRSGTMYCYYFHLFSRR